MEKYKVCSGSCLKVIAIVCMLVDHTTGRLLSDCAWAITPWFELGHLSFSPYFLLRSVVGRIAFPIFAFLLVEGYTHTRDVRRYALRLLIFALLTEPIWDLAHTGTFISLRGQNVLFTLALGVGGMWLMDHVNKSILYRILAFAGITLLAFLIRCDYGAAGVAFIMLLYLFYGRTDCQLLTLIGVFGRSYYSMAATLSIIPIALYNGQRGFIKGAFGKYLFYIIYPLHLLILYFLKYYILK